MNKLLKYVEEYLKVCNWKDLALIKFCLCSIGVILGLAAPKKLRKPLVFVAVTVFVATYIPLMLKFFKEIGRAHV